MTPLLVATLLCLLLGLLSLTACVRGVRRRRWLAGARHGGSALLTLGLSTAGFGVALNLYTYDRLTAEVPVAEITFARTAPERYEARLDLPDGGSRVYPMAGDEWQLDARVLKWRGPAQFLGLAPRYRLERLNGRWSDAERERSETRSVHTLGADAGLDLWAVARRHGLPWVDALYGSAAYLPMADGARYAVSLSSTGLVARPLDDAAETAVRSWH